ncbi:gliding motility-associated protein GldE [Litoribacter ruber]|uniref:Gliding motility-associated protein GldE n=1 Tax=Litoribacter ruber TaxID=702568 RepID=A0AAP2CIS1_9BACT|nr:MULTISPECIES: gliding motility-associated protein GldE [Litoribacter]MBS9523335.1 gliding motility-associated protein GldE [Litoribacter alkaliphilus]MBT0812539.1 gliding motility-associated protein GldE [Litoribacter ruber]
MDDDPYPSILLLAEALQASAGYIVINSFIFILLLIFSALVSGSEVAFFSLSHDDLNQLNEENDGQSQKVIQLVETPQKLLSTILILNNLINIGIVMLTTFITWSIMGTSVASAVVIFVQTVGVTFAIVFFGEIVPKVYANKARIPFSKAMASTIGFFSTLLKPLSVTLMALSNVIENRIEKKGYTLSVDELHKALEITSQDTTTEEKDFLKGIVNFSTLSVRQVMQSRMDITAVDVDMDFHELMDKINKSGYSRIPVYKDTIDNIQGILYIKDLLNFIEKDEHFKWQELIRKGMFVPENKKVDTLLKDFQKKRVHMAIVVDEYGGTSGLVTLEDLIEEIIGEINDEFDDKDDIFFQQLDENTFVFEGKISLHDFCKKLDLDAQIFDEVKGDSESLGGLLLEINSKLPKGGAKIKYDRFVFTIMAVDTKRIKKVKVHILPQKEEIDNYNSHED